MLTLARVAQGLGGAALMSVNTALIRLIYPKRQLGRGMGINSFVVAVSSAAGLPLPPLSSRLLPAMAVLINVPLGIISIFLAMRFYRPTAAPARLPVSICRAR